MIAAIVACTENGVIGFQNSIPWHLPVDSAYFKRITLNHTLVMGRKNFESIGKPLPKRTNIVVTRDINFKHEGIIVEHSIENALKRAEEISVGTIFIIGGGEIYSSTYHLWDKLYYTEIHAQLEGDVFFKPQNWEDWVLESEEFHSKDEKNAYDYTFKVFVRKKKI